MTFETTVLSKDSLAMMPAAISGLATATPDTAADSFVFLDATDGLHKKATLSTISTSGVTSVALSGGTTGLTVTGSPITTAGTITLDGVLAIANGGTGASSGVLLDTDILQRISLRV